MFTPFASLTMSTGKSPHNKQFNLEDFYGDHMELLRRCGHSKPLLMCGLANPSTKVHAVYEEASVQAKLEICPQILDQGCPVKSIPKRHCGTEKNERLPPDTKLAGLNPELDNDGILRVHGRALEAAVLPLQRFPIILPKDHQYTVSLIFIPMSKTITLR